MTFGNVEQFASDMNKAPVVAILRGVTPDKMLPVCHALADGGVRFIEATMNSPIEPLKSIGMAVEEFKGSDVHIGAGTVLTPEEVEQIAAVGAEFIVSPNFDEAVVRKTKELGLISAPGFFTPSEAFAAVKAGADFLKCFPANANGPGYIKDLKAVCPAPILAVGGVNTENVGDYLSVAVGVGIGSSIYKPDFSMEKITELTKIFMQAVADQR